MTKQAKFVEQFEGEFWECSNCELAWVFNTGSPEENQCFYCPKCGYKFAEYVKDSES